MAVKTFTTLVRFNKGIQFADNTIQTTAATNTGGSMTYPDAGIPISTGSAWGSSIPNNSANWNAAYSWGNHNGLYKLSSYVPNWTEITNKPTIYPPSTHDHNSLYKPISYVPNWNEITNKPTNYPPSTHDHNSLYKPISYVPNWSEITNTPTTLSGYGIIDAANSSHNHNSSYKPISYIPTWTEITNKPTTYPPSTHDHNSLYKPITYVPNWNEITSKPTFATVSTTGSYNDLIDKPETQELDIAIPQLLGIKLPVLTSVEISALTRVKGLLVFNSTSNVLQIYNGSVWKTISTN